MNESSPSTCGFDIITKSTLFLFHDSGFLSKMTGRTNIEMEEAFLFDKSLILCHNKGRTEMFGSDDEYSFWIRFPMNILKVEDPCPESQYFIVSAPTSTCGEDFTSEAQCTLDTALTLEAKTESVKKVWMREIRGITDRRTMCYSRLTTGCFE